MSSVSSSPEVDEWDVIADEEVSAICEEDETTTQQPSTDSASTARAELEEAKEQKHDDSASSAAVDNEDWDDAEFAVCARVHDVLRVTHPNWLDAAQGPAAGAVPEEKIFAVTTEVFTCSLCKSVITGTRYKCLYCEAPGYHLCAPCESNHSHDELHPFIKIANARQCPDHGVVASQRRSRNLRAVGVVGVANGAHLSTNEQFFAGWRLKNHGDCAWPKGCVLQWVGGKKLGYDAAKQKVTIPPAAPGEEVEVLVELRAPKTTGRHRGIFRVAAEDGTFFGSPLITEVQVKSKKFGKYSSELAQLAEIGLTNRGRNLAMLKKGMSVADIVDRLVE